MKKRRGFLLYLLVIAMLLTMTSPAVLFAAEVTAEEDTEEYAEEISYIMQEIVESDLVFNISVYTNDDNIIFYSLPEHNISIPWNTFCLIPYIFFYCVLYMATDRWN